MAGLAGYPSGMLIVGFAVRRAVWCVRVAVGAIQCPAGVGHRNRNGLSGNDMVHRAVATGAVHIATIATHVHINTTLRVDQ